MNKKRSLIPEKIVVVLWPLFSIILMWITMVAWSNILTTTTYSGGFDSAAFVTGFLTVTGHLIAFLTLPTLIISQINQAVLIDKTLLIMIGIFGLLALTIQSYARIASANLNQLGCGDVCAVYNLPRYIDDAVSVFTIGILIVGYIGILVYSARKAGFIKTK